MNNFIEITLKCLYDGQDIIYFFNIPTLWLQKDYSIKISNYQKRIATQIAKQKSEELKNEVVEETKKQLEQPEAMTIDQLLLRTEGEPAIEIDVYPEQ